ncbi:hypothetical protein ACFP3I_25155 [Chryseobacterium arachidis]
MDTGPTVAPVGLFFPTVNFLIVRDHVHSNQGAKSTPEVEMCFH